MLPRMRSSFASLKVLALAGFLGGAIGAIGVSCTDESGNGHYTPDASMGTGGTDGGGGAGGGESTADGGDAGDATSDGSADAATDASGTDAAADTMP